MNESSTAVEAIVDQCAAEFQRLCEGMTLDNYVDFIDCLQVGIVGGPVAANKVWEAAPVPIRLLILSAAAVGMGRAAVADIRREETEKS